MARVRITLENWRGNDAEREVIDQLNKGIRKFTADLERRTQAVSPVDTGRMKASHDVEHDDSRITHTLVVDTDYAYFVHSGTARQRAQPWVIDTVNLMAPSAATYFR